VEPPSYLLLLELFDVLIYLAIPVGVVEFIRRVSGLGKGDVVGPKVKLFGSLCLAYGLALGGGHVFLSVGLDADVWAEYVFMLPWALLVTVMGRAPERAVLFAVMPVGWILCLACYVLVPFLVVGRWRKPPASGHVGTL
jgi:hypothetical protein